MKRLPALILCLALVFGYAHAQTVGQVAYGQTDVIWGACSYNAIKMTASKLGLNGSDRFFIEQVI